MREELRSMYMAHPTGLAIELELLFEPCEEATYAVLHNAVIQKIHDLCGEEVTDPPAHGVEPKKHVVLTCKNRLAKALAEAILSQIRIPDDSK